MEDDCGLVLSQCFFIPLSMLFAMKTLEDEQLTLSHLGYMEYNARVL